ncbi:hypothetical protein WN51_04490 [Melipona quadrifasciata]|uniref:Uncharacterized protein n=1 Tax=Melipona quadrifasciata TaxID=166423 RepID=A0A0M8ZS29_9HYME|nr:hypothetical protein WN51_04490 [Melipona quadrifasciata]
MRNVETEISTSRARKGCNHKVAYLGDGMGRGLSSARSELRGESGPRTLEALDKQNYPWANIEGRRKNDSENITFTARCRFNSEKARVLQSRYLGKIKKTGSETKDKRRSRRGKGATGALCERKRKPPGVLTSLAISPRWQKLDRATEQLLGICGCFQRRVFCYKPEADEEITKLLMHQYPTPTSFEKYAPRVLAGWKLSPALMIMPPMSREARVLHAYCHLSSVNSWIALDAKQRTGCKGKFVFFYAVQLYIFDLMETQKADNVGRWLRYKVGRINFEWENSLVIIIGEAKKETAAKMIHQFENMKISEAKYEVEIRSQLKSCELLLIESNCLKQNFYYVSEKLSTEGRIILFTNQYKVHADNKLVITIAPQNEIQMTSKSIQERLNPNYTTAKETRLQRFTNSD